MSHSKAPRALKGICCEKSILAVGSRPVESGFERRTFGLRMKLRVPGPCSSREDPAVHVDQNLNLDQSFGPVRFRLACVIRLSGGDYFEVKKGILVADHGTVPVR